MVVFIIYTETRLSFSAKAKKIYMNDNLSSLDRIVLCFAEFLGTGILVFIGCMGCAHMGSLPDPMKIAFAFGLAIMIAVQVSYL